MITTFWLLAAGHLLLAAAEGCPTFDFWELAATVGPVLESRPLGGASAPAGRWRPQRAALPYFRLVVFRPESPAEAQLAKAKTGPPGAPTCLSGVAR